MPLQRKRILLTTIITLRNRLLQYYIRKLQDYNKEPAFNYIIRTLLTDITGL